MIPGWKELLEREYLAVLREHPTTTPRDLAARLGVSEGVATYWLTDLAREGRVRILGVEVAENAELESSAGVAQDVTFVSEVSNPRRGGSSFIPVSRKAPGKKPRRKVSS